MLLPHSVQLSALLEIWQSYKLDQEVASFSDWGPPFPYLDNVFKYTVFLDYPKEH